MKLTKHRDGYVFSQLGNNKRCGIIKSSLHGPFTRKLEKPIGQMPDFSQLFMKLKGMKFCTQVPRTCVDKRLFLEFHIFA